MTLPHAAELDGASIPTLMEYLRGDDPLLRGDAACALGDRLRAREIAALEPAVLEQLVALLDDGIAIVRLEAALALAEAHDSRALPVLLHNVRGREHRLDALRALGALGDRAAVPVLTRLLQGLWVPWADRMQAAAALCALGDAAGADYLRGRLASRRRAERAAALHFCAEARHPDALAILRAVLESAQDPQRDVAARALGLLGGDAAREVLAAALPGAEGELAEDIRAALAQSGR